MIIHHIATIILLYFSWMMNLVRIGTLVLFVHDAADPFLAVTVLHIDGKTKHNITAYDKIRKPATLH